MQVCVILHYVSAAATFNVETFTAGSFDAIAFRFRITIVNRVLFINLETKFAIRILY